MHLADGSFIRSHLQSPPPNGMIPRESECRCSSLREAVSNRSPSRRTGTIQRPAGRSAVSRFTRTAPPGRSVAVRCYAAVNAGGLEVALLERAEFLQRGEQALLPSGGSNDRQSAQVA